MALKAEAPDHGLQGWGLAWITRSFADFWIINLRLSGADAESFADSFSLERMRRLEILDNEISSFSPRKIPNQSNIPQHCRKPCNPFFFASLNT